MVGIFKDDYSEWFDGFEFEDGSTQEYNGEFAVYGAEYTTEFAAQIGSN